MYRRHFRMSVRPIERKLCSKVEIEIAVKVFLSHFSPEAMNVEAGCAKAMAALPGKTEASHRGTLQ